MLTNIIEIKSILENNKIQSELISFFNMIKKIDIKKYDNKYFI